MYQFPPDRDHDYDVSDVASIGNIQGTSVKNNITDLRVYRREKRNDHWVTDLVHFLDQHSHPFLVASMRNVVQSFVEFLTEENKAHVGALILGLGLDATETSLTLSFYDRTLALVTDQDKAVLVPFATMICSNTDAKDASRYLSLIHI